tara:strand:+ start:1722 stop:2012 length:291 start_codon:yes stop_codon:yes gene_type:complete
MTEETQNARRAAMVAPDIKTATPVEEDTSPYQDGPYLVLDDGSTYSSNGQVVYITRQGSKQLEMFNDFENVDYDEMEVITLDQLLNAYNKVHGTNL